jgi:hypothetical protein
MAKNHVPNETPNVFIGEKSVSISPLSSGSTGYPTKFRYWKYYALFIDFSVKTTPATTQTKIYMHMVITMYRSVFFSTSDFLTFALEPFSMIFVSWPV